MKNLLGKIRNTLSPFFITKVAGIYLILIAFVIGIATFIENDYGIDTAQKVIFRSWWFDLLLLLFGITIIVNIFKFRIIQQKKWPLVIFHGAIIIILIGSGVTRYFGFEGIMHIRENDVSNSFLSSNSFLKFKVIQDDKTYDFDEPVLFTSLGNNNWQESYQIGNDLIEINVKEYVPNPKRILNDDIDGRPTLQIVVDGANGRQEYFIGKGETKRIRNVTYNFKDTHQLPQAINVIFRNDSLLFKSDRTLTQTVMATQKKDTLYGSSNYKPLKLGSLYSDGVNNFVFSDFNKNGKVRIESEDPKVKNESLMALLIDLSVNGKTRETYVYGKKGLPSRPKVLNFDELSVSVSYGAKEVVVPFLIKLNEFILDKYPRTNSVSSYVSEVTLVDDKKEVKFDYRIFKNNILDYDGYRFFQSSFDKDENGTYLRVKRDFGGTWISYLGYALLTLGMLLIIFKKIPFP